MPTSACPPLIYSCPRGWIPDKLELWTALGLSFRDQSDGRVAVTEAEHVAPPPPNNSPACLVLAELSGEKVTFSAEAELEVGGWQHQLWGSEN